MPVAIPGLELGPFKHQCLILGGHEVITRHVLVSPYRNLEVLRSGPDGEVKVVLFREYRVHILHVAMVEMCGLQTGSKLLTSAQWATAWRRRPYKGAHLLSYNGEIPLTLTERVTQPFCRE